MKVNKNNFVSRKVGLGTTVEYTERKFKTKALERHVAKNPWRSPGSNLRHQIALPIGKSNFVWKLMKNQIEWHCFCCHGDVIAKWSLKHEKGCQTKLSPGRHKADYQAQISTTNYIWDTLHGNSTKTSSSGELLNQNCRNVLFKNMLNSISVAMVTMGKRRRLKINFCFANWFI